jgi:hypothetical protein
MIYLKIASNGLVGALIFAAAWGIQSNRHEAKISTLVSAHEEAVTKATENAYAETIRLQKAKDEAVKSAQIRQSALARDLSISRDAVSRLSKLSTTVSVSACSDSNTTTVKPAIALAEVFQQCSARLVEMGAAADGHANDVQTLMDSWPK